MSKKLDNRINLYFNKSQQDVCEYLNRIDDKSAFVVELVRKHMHNEQILGAGVSSNIETIMLSLDQIKDFLFTNNLPRQHEIEHTIKSNSNVCEKTTKQYTPVNYNPADDF